MSVNQRQYERREPEANARMRQLLQDVPRRYVGQPSFSTNNPRDEAKFARLINVSMRVLPQTGLR